MSSHPETQSQPIEIDVTAKERVTWSEMPLRGRPLLTWLFGLLVLTVFGVLVGTLITGPLNDSIGTFDRQVAQALGDWRNPTWNNLTMVGSSLADSYVKIPATVILCGLFLWRWKRWEEAVLLAGALVLESTAFVTMSFIVDRSRPNIQQLDPIPPTGSFPSGHTGAAVAFYGAIAIIVLWHSRRASMRALAVTAAVLVPPIVAFSRMYRGMHFFSDVTFGALVGFVALVITYRVLVLPHGSRAGSRQ